MSKLHSLLSAHIRLTFFACMTAFITLTVSSLTPLAAAAQDRSSHIADPNDPALFMDNPNKSDHLVDRLGPGNAPIRKNSFKDDVHENVEGFAHARYCLSCHEGQDKNLHYARTNVQCKTCHVSRPIAGIHNQNATMFAPHRAQKVCVGCHEGATAALSQYVIHEPSPFAAKTRTTFPALFYSAWAMVVLAGSVFFVFAPYVLAWAAREGRLWFSARAQPTPGKPSHSALHIERFGMTERLFHTGLAICFMMLSVTGLSWMFIETDFGRGLATLFGDYHGAILIHRLVGVALMVLFAVHLFYILHRVDWRHPDRLAGPDSLVWKMSDFSAFWHHLKWLVGKADHPAFDRWAWWQKFDYWAVWWGTMIVGITGLVMFDPILTSNYLPGWTLNVARWVHKIEALLAMTHIFVVHFFIESYRPRAFPLSDHVFHGAANLEELRLEHPEWIARLVTENRLRNLTVTQPPRPIQIAYFTFGILMVALGLFLLVGAVLNIGLLS